VSGLQLKKRWFHQFVTWCDYECDNMTTTPVYGSNAIRLLSFPSILFLKKNLRIDFCLIWVKVDSIRYHCTKQAEYRLLCISYLHINNFGSAHSVPVTFSIILICLCVILLPFQIPRSEISSTFQMFYLFIYLVFFFWH